MKIPKIPLAQTTIQLCKSKGIKHIVISPGSRNAPLTIGFTNDPFFTCYSIVDERCAAFFALGIAQQVQKPTAVVCTSGSALLNYYPAVAEAYYSNIPLVVLSADRPKYLVNIGDGQTINQPDVYGKHVVYSTNLKEDIDETKSTQFDEEPSIMKSLENRLEKFLGLQQSIQEKNAEEINKALNKAISKSGPVHINVPFAEPLYETVDSYQVNPKVIPLEETSKKTAPEDLDNMVSAWNAAERILVLIGSMQPNYIEQQWLDALAENSKVVVMTETTSNCHHGTFLNSIDQVIAPLNKEGEKQLQPDLLISLGGMIVSKKIKTLLRNHSPKAHWHIGEHGANDTFFKLSLYINTQPNTFFEQVLSLANEASSDFNNHWLDIKKQRKAGHQSYLKTIPFSDFKVFEQLIKSFPKDINLQMGNSSAIRYLQLFDVPKSVDVFCNRGTSGIDGSTSTAIGASVASEKQTILITGDLSFFYDSNALWNNYISKNFRIVVINNGGGGIFRILPGDKDSDNFDLYFETKHDLTAKQLCEMYHFQYAFAENEDELDKELSGFYNDSSVPKLLEIKTPSTMNDDVLLRYFDYLK